jgi:hypothetical protein
VENLSHWDLGGTAEYVNRPEGRACVTVRFNLGDLPEEVG